MADNASLPLPRDGSSTSLLAWANTVVNYLRRNVVSVTERITTVVTEQITPIEEDRDATLAAAEAYALDVQAAITAANDFAQATYDAYETAAQAGQAELAQFYLTQAANRVEQRVRIDSDAVLSESISTVQASLALTNAAITTETTARVNGDSALASQITTVQSQANGNSATITQLANSIDGIEANWAVVVNQNGHVTGYIRLDTQASGSNFTVVADRFIVSHPTSAGTLITPFVVGLVNGVSTVGISGNLVVDGTIIGRHLVAGAVTADKIAAATITADKINVASLSALSANIGTVTAGVLKSDDNKMIVDLSGKSITMTT